MLTWNSAGFINQQYWAEDGLLMGLGYAEKVSALRISNKMLDSV